jgi:hypothetical protein
MINLKMNNSSIEKPFISNEYLTIAVTYHKEHPAFAKRPLTTLLTESISRATNLNIGESFTLLNFSLLFLCGILLFYFATLLGSTSIQASLSVILFFLSFSILFAFFPPIYSYDEPLQYLFVFLSILPVLRSNWAYYILFFSLSLITRESSVILLPGIAILALVPLNQSTVLSKKLLLLLLPIFIYIFYLYYFISANDITTASKQDFSERLMHFEGNFRNLKFTAESVVSFILAIGFHTYILYCYTRRNLLSAIEKSFVAAFILVLAINTLVVILTTQARETRLFALPLVFLFPFLGKFILKEYQYLRTKIARATTGEIFKCLPFLLISILLIVGVTNRVYFQTIGSLSENLFNEYLAAVLIVLVSHFIIRFVLKPRGFTECKPKY